MTSQTADPTTRTDVTLFRFDPSTAFAPWAAIDDSVIGGTSYSTLAVGDDGSACFSGHLAGGGTAGFCSVRSADLCGLFTGHRAVVLGVRGDGKTYTLCLHTRTLLPDTSYRCRFSPTAGIWERVVLPFDQFVLTRNGNRVGVSPVVPAAISALSLMISDRQDGPFALGLSDVTLVSEARG